ncbi:hypothetical protein DPMN_040602 [Dreissena polymorpha]|uniref:Uncharacterized protein n=1 Tax=Dreissena polymorpha TaxID=45954 RepID=A0A9D4CVN7_DREPO|nr:hypothetical protein DPMN_040602 [Dreissena polymorpha]
MATIVSRSLPDGIGQGHRPMPDQLATAIRLLSGDNAGNFMTGTSPGTGPVTGDRSGHRSNPLVTGQQRPIRSPVNKDRSGHRSETPVTGQQRLVRSQVRPTCHRSTLTGPVTGQTHRSPVNKDQSGHRSETPVIGYRSPVRPNGQRRPVRSPVRPSGHQSIEFGPVTGLNYQSLVTGHMLLMTGHRSVLQVTGQLTSHWTPVNMPRSLTGQQLLVTGQRSETDVRLHRIIPLLRRRMHILHRLVPMIEVDDVGHALIHRAVLFHVIMIIIDHHGNDTQGDVIPVVAVLALGVVTLLDLGITGIKVVHKLH